MKINALSPWYGAKRKFAPHVVAAIGKHRAFYEPFCGSLAILFSKPPAALEVVNDLHGDLINLARHMAAQWSGSSALYERLQHTLTGPDIFKDSAAVIEGEPFEPTVERAYHFFVYSWQGRSGTIGTTGKQSFAMRYTSNGGSPSIRFRSAVDSIPEWVSRLRSTVITNDDGFKMIDRVEDAYGAVLYADPPYLTKSAKYAHDFADADHARLAVALQRFKRSRVVVSYYDHPTLATLYPGWTVLRFEVGKNITQAGKRDVEGADTATEVLLVNRADPTSLDILDDRRVTTTPPPA